MHVTLSIPEECADNMRAESERWVGMVLMEGVMEDWRDGVGGGGFVISVFVSEVPGGMRVSLVGGVLRGSSHDQV
ncbi:hypothetical protein K1719_034945 [Acacia pycnantha]|nr:hypothetical protein K1719_038890 [Acacia pycnantha]KAI9083041.1 hypothetical protein K1719_034945 [Acacia pycnantha]